MKHCYVEVYIDGRKNRLKGGPRSKNGGILVEFFSEQEGKSVRVCEITCIRNKNGKLVITHSKFNHILYQERQ